MRSSQIKIAFWLIILILGCLQAWASRFSLSSIDAISYMDIAHEYLIGNWKHAINAYWSPLYSWLLMPIELFKIPSYWEFFAVKIINLLGLVFAIACFEFFFKSIKRPPINESAWVIFGYSIFALSALKWLGVNLDSPDMITSGFIYLATGLLLRAESSPSPLSFAALGVVLGFGYLSKSIMFPMALVILGISFFKLRDRVNYRNIAIAILTFSIISLPFVTAISIQKSKLTFGETGKLNYMWFVSTDIGNHMNDTLWRLEEFNLGLPKHPAHQLLKKPLVYDYSQDFDKVIGGTGSIWSDPSYWHDGLKANFNLTRQVKVLINNLKFYYKFLFGRALFIFVAFAYICDSLQASATELRKNSLLLIGLIGLALYALSIDIADSFWQTRYIAPFAVLICLGLAQSVAIPDSAKRSAIALILTIALLTGNTLLNQAIQNVKIVAKPQQHYYWNIANDLNKLGVKPGDSIAFLGGHRKEFYIARLARVKFAVHIPKVAEFWNVGGSERRNAIAITRNAGVTAILQENEFKLPANKNISQWHQLGNTDSYALILKEKPQLF